MLENLINLVKEHAGDAIVNNPAIDNKHNDAAIETTASSILDSLKGQLGSGGISGLTSLFQGGAGGNSSMLQNITKTVTSNLASKFGISGDAAGNIASSLIPTVMNKFINKTNDPNDSSFDLQGIIGQLGSGGGLGSMLGKLFK
jgi:Bacterial protein of unknown function (DUF937)